MDEMPQPLETSVPVADGERHRLDPRVIPAQRLARWLFAGPALLVTLAAVMVGAFFSEAGTTLALITVWLCGAALLVWWAHAWPALAYRHASYSVDGSGIEIRRGVVWRRVITVPRSRVQHTDVSQGPIERSHALGTLVIYTAGTSYAQVQVPGLSHATALAIRDHLLPAGGPDAV
jgi:membrane protein YdbS with pleckstrin-like domain